MGKGIWGEAETVCREGPVCVASGVSPLGHVCPGLALGTAAPAGGEHEGLPGCKHRGLG